MGIHIGAEARHGQGFLDGVGQRLLRRLTISGHAVLGLVLVPGAPVLLDLAALAVLHEPELDFDGVADLPAQADSLVAFAGKHLVTVVESLLKHLPAPTDTDRAEHFGRLHDHRGAVQVGDLLAADLGVLGVAGIGGLHLLPDAHVGCGHWKTSRQAGAVS